MAWMIGRTQTNGKRTTTRSVHRFQDGLSLVPLSAWGSEYPAAGCRARSTTGVDAATPPPAQVAAMDAATFFGRLASLMVANPPYEADAPALRAVRGDRARARLLRRRAARPRRCSTRACKPRWRSSRRSAARSGEPVNGW